LLNFWRKSNFFCAKKAACLLKRSSLQGATYQVCSPPKLQVSKAVLCSRLVAASIPEYATGWPRIPFVPDRTWSWFKLMTLCLSLIHGGGVTRPLLKDGCEEEFHGDPTVGPRPKVWIRSQKWKK